MLLLRGPKAGFYGPLPVWGSLASAAASVSQSAAPFNFSPTGCKFLLVPIRNSVNLPSVTITRG